MNAKGLLLRRLEKLKHLICIMRNIILRSLRLIGHSTSATITRIVLDTWVDHHQVQRYNQLLTLLSADLRFAASWQQRGSLLF